MTGSNIIIRLSIIGDIPSLKNVIRFGRNGQVYHQNNCIIEYKTDFKYQTIQQLKKRPRWSKVVPFLAPVMVGLTIYQGNRRRDGHNQMSTVFDALEYAGVIKNDRQIISWFGKTKLDRKNPRVEITVMEGQGGD